MRCLYCGKQLALFRRLTGGGEFCSDAHKDSYHEEFNRLALARLKQAQEKSDELRAAAPQNQLALIRRGSGEPEGPTIRSNAHWIEAKPQQRRSLAIAGPEPAPEPASPKQADFINAMPQPAQATVPSLTDAPQPDPISPAIQNVKPEWAPPMAPLVLPPAAQLQSSVVPHPRDYEIKTDFPVPGAVDMTLQRFDIPPVVPPPPARLSYPSQPAVEIEPLRFAPGFDAQVEALSQFLPFRFDFAAFRAPDFDILEPAEEPPSQLKVRPRLALKRTEQEHVLDPPTEEVQPIRRKGAAAANLMELAAIGEIGALANPMTPLYPKSAAPSETAVQPDSVRLQPPSTIMPRSSVLGFRENEAVTTGPAVDDPDDKRPSALKLKLAAMAPALTPTATVPEPPKAAARAAAPASRNLERKPIERATAPPPAIAVPRRRTVPIPSILEPPDPDGDDHKSLWGALRKYLGK